MTNNHVVEGATSVTVTFSDGFTTTGKVIGTDSYSDLAVVQVDVPASRLQPVLVADSSQVKVGEVTIAIGNPFGLSGTMTTGIVSALNRSLDVQGGSTTTGTYQIPDIIQTDASINPGNSGGVLVNDLGQLIGVTAAIESSTNSSAGIGFAIPSRIVEKVVPSLISNGKYDSPYLGVEGTTLTTDIAKAMGLSEDQRGALVVSVTSGGPADQAGLKGSTQSTTTANGQLPTGGDIITAVDGNQVNTFQDVVTYLMESTSAGQTVKLTILRDGKEQTIDVTLGVRPSSTTTQTSSTTSGQTAYLGIQGTSLTSGIDSALNLNANQTGILVTKVASGSPAEQAGLKGGTQTTTVNGQQITTGGDIIIGIDGMPISGMDELKSVLATYYQPGDQMVLTIIRNGAQMDLTVTLGSATGQ